MNTILYLIVYFILYSFAGWILESVTKSIAQKKFVNSGFLNGPFCPIYGFGALIMLLGLNSLKGKPFLLFVAAFLLLSIWEYSVGVVLEKIFKTKYWDYSHLKFNISGRVCLKNSIYWGILGVLFICYIHPFIANYIEKIPVNVILSLNLIIGIAMLIDFIASIVTTTNFETTMKKLNDLTENIMDKVKELKELNKKAISKTIEKSSIESIEKIIRELKITQARLKLKIYKRANRLKKAFPTMKSENITAFLNQKIDIEKLKQSIKRKNKE